VTARARKAPAVAPPAPVLCAYPRCRSAATGVCGQCGEPTCHPHTVFHPIGPINPLPKEKA